MSKYIEPKMKYKTLNKTQPLTSGALESMLAEGWMLISSLSYQEGDNWGFVYYFKNIKLGTREWK